MCVRSCVPRAEGGHHQQGKTTRREKETATPTRFWPPFPAAASPAPAWCGLGCASHQARALTGSLCYLSWVWGCARMPGPSVARGRRGGEQLRCCLLRAQAAPALLSASGLSLPGVLPRSHPVCTAAPDPGSSPLAPPKGIGGCVGDSRPSTAAKGTCGGGNAPVWVRRGPTHTPARPLSCEGGGGDAPCHALQSDAPTWAV